MMAEDVGVIMEEYTNFIKEYHKNSEHQRIGQYFCNKYNVTNPELFYSENHDVALKMIFDLFFEGKVKEEKCFN